MVKDVYAVKHKNMILVFCTLFNKKSTFIMVRITAVGCLGGKRGCFICWLLFVYCVFAQRILLVVFLLFGERGVDACNIEWHWTAFFVAISWIFPPFCEIFGWYLSVFSSIVSVSVVWWGVDGNTCGYSLATPGIGYDRWMTTVFPHLHSFLQKIEKSYIKYHFVGILL